MEAWWEVTLLRMLYWPINVEVKDFIGCALVGPSWTLWAWDLLPRLLPSPLPLPVFQPSQTPPTGPSSAPTPRTTAPSRPKTSPPTRPRRRRRERSRRTPARRRTKTLFWYERRRKPGSGYIFVDVRAARKVFAGCLQDNVFNQVSTQSLKKIFFFFTWNWFSVAKLRLRKRRRKKELSSRKPNRLSFPSSSFSFFL